MLDYDNSKGALMNKPSNAKAEKDLIEAVLALETVDECRRFLRDICTPKEITDLADRWLVARMLDEGKLSYREIHALTGVSVTTVGRVARFLQQESYKGYRTIIDRLKKK
jgi:TrpR-related protein YerC/YecD